MRIPRGATTLIKAVEARRKQVSWERVGEPDGLGVHRAIRFNKATSNWLTPLLEEIADPRIIGIEPDDDGLVVTFVPSVKADSRDPYPLDEAAEILKQQRST